MEIEKATPPRWSVSNLPRPLNVSVVLLTSYFPSSSCAFPWRFCRSRDANKREQSLCCQRNDLDQSPLEAKVTFSGKYPKST